jgi:hypothetical protein
LSRFRGAGYRKRGDKEEATSAAVPRRLEHIGRPVAVRSHEFRHVASGDFPGDVIHHVHARAPLAEDGLIVQVALEEPNVVSPALQLGEGGSSRERRDGVAPGQQCLHEVRADKAGSARHEDVHSGLS